MSTIQEAYQRMDEVVRKVTIQTVNDGRPISCRKGCFACCHEPMWATALEARYIVEGLDLVDRMEVTCRTEAWLAQARASGLLGIPFDSLSTHQWLPRQIACPLLQDGLCVAYPRRPAGCRTYLAVTPPEYCQPERRREAMLVQCAAFYPAIGSLLVLALDDTMRHLGAHLARLLLPNQTVEDQGISVEAAVERDMAKVPDLAGWQMECPR